MVGAEMARAVRPGGRVALSAFSSYFAVRVLEAGDSFDAATGVNHERTSVRDAAGRAREFDLWTTCFTPRELRLLAALLEEVDEDSGPRGLAEVAQSLADGHKLTEAPASLRMPLVAAETERLAALGADCAQALEGAMRAWRPADRECDLAARIAAALEERLMFPAVVRVGGAQRRRAFRHPVPYRTVTGSDVLAVVVGVRGGLNVACSRSASAGSPDPGLAARHEAACAVEAAMITATSPGWRWADVLRAGQAAYRDAGFDGEWREHVQGGPIGYLSREFDVVPGTPGAAEVIESGTAFAWNPTVRGAKSEDTFVVSRSGAAVPVTNTADWPVTASGRPAILPV